MQKAVFFKRVMAVMFLGSLFVSSLVFAHDRDNNAPGPVGGRGTNWENPPGPRGGWGSSPNRRHHHSHHYCRYHDCDGNPPGPLGGWGTNWENPAGPVGGPGASPDRH